MKNKDQFTCIFNHAACLTFLFVSVPFPKVVHFFISLDSNVLHTEICTNCNCVFVQQNVCIFGECVCECFFACVQTYYTGMGIWSLRFRGVVSKVISRPVSLREQPVSVTGQFQKPTQLNSFSIETCQK